ncbi:hypothetical protein PILCRDRAFT_827753 [Piloderma croceum F 1598]|uniref:Diaminopimelate epimerase-like protein n=1 Tax=Piloderma croceum (strain F 1598) TaxID=765440 RepID=A0A0C3BC69_PILCF|nr:hypothetical protein PILCRDRAFT_827753 [Piloderma croceum F 1598]
MSFTAPFSFFDVFTSSPTCGNPAAVVFLPTRKQQETLQEIASSLDQPIAVFLSRSDTACDHGVATFDVHWFTSTTEMPIIGHGLIAAAAALFAPDPSSHKADLFDLAPETTTIQFRSEADVTLTTRRHTLANWYELELPASPTTPIPLDSDEGRRICRIIGRALGCEKVDGDAVVFVGKGGEGYENYLMVELDQNVDLGACEVDTGILTETQPYTINVLSSEGHRDKDIAFVSRMFAPTVGLPEDHVYGSAHALLTPYYTSKRRARSEEPSSQPAVNLELHAKQMSKRGGDLRVVWDEERGIVKIAGEVVRTGGGSWVYKSVDKYDPGTYVYKDGWKASYRW